MTTDINLSEPIVIVVKGTPRPQPRPRMLKSGVVVSTANREVRSWADRIRLTVRGAMMDRYGYGFQGFEGPVRVDMIFTLPVKDSSKWGNWCTARPDVDNIFKLAGDALEKAGVFRTGDQQIVCGETAKLYGPEEAAGVTITISPPREAPVVCGMPAAVGLQALDKPTWLA